MSELSTSTVGKRRFTARLLGTLVAILFLLGSAGYLHRTHSALSLYGTPYEAWDEIAGYNTSFVLAGDHVHRAHFYGTLDIAKFVLADTLYTRIDPVGMTRPRLNFSNNVPETLNDHRVFYGPNFWKPKALGAIEYVYFRGVQDRTPIFWARFISLSLCIAAYLLVGTIVIREFGPRALFLLVALACFMVPRAYYEQFAHSLPAGFNSVLILGLMLLCLSYLVQPTSRKLVFVGAIFAIAVNSKFDAVAYGAAIAPVPFFGYWVHRHSARQLGVAIIALAAAFATVLFVTNPYLWFDPLLQLDLKRQFLSGVGVGSPSLLKNCSVFGAFAQSTLSPIVDGKFLFSPAFAGWLLVGIVVFAVSATYAVTSGDEKTQRQRSAVALVSAAFVGVALLVPILLSNTLYPRYFLPAFALILALLAHALNHLMDRVGCRWVAYAGLAVMLAFLISQGRRISGMAHSIRIDLATHKGLASHISRNRAVEFLLDDVLKHAPKTKILVDQHSYTDLRALLLAGANVRYVNALNFNEVTTAARNSGPDGCVVLFCPGTTQVPSDWMGIWTPEMSASYDGYMRSLEGLPVLMKTGETRFPLLNWAPLGSNDLTIVARLQ